MDRSNPFLNDDIQTDEERMEWDHKLREQGLNPRELSQDEVKDISNDMRGDQTTHEIHDDGEDLSDLVTPEENDGND